MRYFKKLHFLIIVALVAIPLAVYAASKAGTDTGYIGGGTGEWIVQTDGDIIPVLTTQDIGESGYEVDVGYFDEIYLGGTSKTSWGSVVSPMTDADGYVYPTDSGGVYRLYDAGYLSLGAGTAIDVYMLFDTDDDDWYIGRDDTDNDFAIGVGSTLGTDERLSIVDSATSTTVVIGDGVNAEDKQLTFDGNATDYYIAYDDSADTLVVGYGSTVGTNPAFGVENSATPRLNVYDGIDAIGAVDIDYGTSDITDHTFVSDGGTVILDGAITLTSSEVISNATDDTVRVASNDVATVLEIYTPGTSDQDVTLLLTADADADAGDRFALVHDGATNDLLFQSDTASADTLATVFTVADSGVITTTAAANVEIDDSANSSVTDIVNIQHFTSGAAAAGIGAGLTFDLENAAGTEEEHASIDVVSTTATNGAEDTDVVVNLMTAGALAEVFRIVAASSTTTGDSFTFTSNTTETNAITDILSLANVTGTAAANTGLGITWDFEDAGGAEEQASLDVQLTTATDTSEDAAFIFSQQTAGAVAETLRIQGASSATTGDSLEFTSNTSETDAVIDIFKLKTATGTAANNSGIGISFEPEDATGSEQQASLDIVLTDATRATADADFVFSQNQNGTITEILRLDASADAIYTTGDLKFQTSIFATGHYTGTSALASAVSGIGSQQPMSYGIVTKDVGSTMASGTWADGTVGQMITISVGTFVGGGWTVTPATTTGFTSFTFDTALDSITILFLDSTRGWIIIGNNGCTIA